MKKIPYENLPYLPWLVAETVCGREYQGQEFSDKVRDSSDVAKYESLRKKMTPEQIRAFGEYADQCCKAAYDAGAPWFMKIVRSKDGRGQLAIWITHWMTSWLQNNVK